MNHKIIIFDVDGTITESGQLISNSMKNTIKNLPKEFDIAILGGGKLDKILYQLDGIPFKHYFTECGCMYHFNDSNDSISLQNKYTINIREHLLYNKINILVKESLLFLSQVDYTLSGNFIDLRNGMIYISLIGMSATQDERKMFIEKNNKFNYRSKLLNILHEKAKELNIYDDVTICEGGSVGLAIYPVENDKIQVLKHLQEQYTEIYYFGDKYTENGNDYKIINDKNVIGYRVDSIYDTQCHLSNIIANYNK